MKDAVRKARIAAGLTLRELSELSTVSESTISNWENGRCVPRADAAILVCDALHISLGEYLGHEAKRD